MEEIEKKFFHILAHQSYSEHRALNCEGIRSRIQKIFKPNNEKELLDLVHEVYKEGLQFYVVSSGNNWGYGTSQPVVNDSVLIDLGLLKNINSFDSELGLVDIQPGVTQQILFDYLQTAGSQWMAPITGAGPDRSIISNALERGFGLNAINDHFASLISLKVLIPSGEIINSNLADLGAYRSDQVSKWKTGPYLEGLFAQSSYGIVLSAQIELAPTPISVDILIVRGDEDELEKIVDFCQSVRKSFPSLIGAINISNKARLEETLSGIYGKERGSWWGKLLFKLIGANIAAYQAIVPIPQHDVSYRGISKSIRRLAINKGLSAKLLNEEAVENGIKLLNLFPIKLFKSINLSLMDLQSFIKLLHGIPSTFALKSAYGRYLGKANYKDLATDRVGLIWFAPILGLCTVDFQKITEILTQVMPKYNQKLLFTFVNFDQKLVEATIPINFDPTNQTEKEKAFECWQELYKECLKVGCAPYRYSTEHMQNSYVQTSARTKIMIGLKKIFDEKNIFNKGRYGKE